MNDYCPNIFQFERLFPLDTGVENRGFPKNSSVVISGLPGTGKTVFALALARDFLSQNPKSKVLYISTEVNRHHLATHFVKFGWFLEDATKGVHKDSLFNPDRFIVTTIDEAKLHQPLKGSNELVSQVFQELKVFAARMDQSEVPLFLLVDSLTTILKDSRDAGERRRQTFEFVTRLTKLVGFNPALMVLVSEAVVGPQGEAPAEESIVDFVFKLALRDTGVGRRMRTVEITKSRGKEINLGVNTWSIISHDSLHHVVAQRLTHDEIIKQIAVQENPDLNPDEILERVAQNPAETTWLEPWGTIAVFPRPELKPIGQRNKTSSPNKQKKGKQEPISSGTPGLDEMLCGDDEYWIRGGHIGSSKKKEGIIKGSTTLLVGSSGSGKSIMTVQFLVAEQTGNHPTGLYVNFENPPERVAQVLPEPLNKKFLKCEQLYRRRSNLDINLLLTELRHVIVKEKSISRVAIDGLSDLLTTTEPREYARLVETLVETIRDAGEQEREDGAIAVFITIESPPDFQVFPALEGLSMTADNVLIMHQLLVNDEFRKMVYVLKARGQRPDTQVREVRIGPPVAPSEAPLRIEPGLEAYSNLLQGSPSPIKVNLQLFAENQAEKNFNRWLETRLGELFGYEMKVYGFSRAELTKTLEDAIQVTGRIPPSDVKVLSLDEWWIRQLSSKSQKMTTKEREEAPPSRLLALDVFMQSTDPNREPVSPPEFWLFEMEKASAIRQVRGGGFDADLLAIPNYTDFGLFCVNRSLAEHVFSIVVPSSFDFRVTSSDPDIGDASPIAPKVKAGPTAMQIEERIDKEWRRHVLDVLPAVWAHEMTSSEGFLGFELPKLVKEPKKGDRWNTMVDLMVNAGKLIATSRNRQPPLKKDEVIGYCFDMEVAETFVCTYLEFCFSCGASESFLIDDLSEFFNDKRSYVAGCAATRAIKLLQYMVVLGLMPARTGIEDSQRALFSRHWYSTLSEQLQPPGGGPYPVWEDRPHLVALPFFPIGQSDPNKALAEAWGDLLIRYRRLVVRTLAAIVARRKKDEGKINPAKVVRKDHGNDEDKAAKAVVAVFTKSWAVLVRIQASLNPPGQADTEKITSAIKDLSQQANTLRTIILESPELIPGTSCNTECIQVSDELRKSLLAAAVVPGDGVASKKVEEELNAALNELCFFSTAGHYLDSRDVLELLRWHDLRLEVIRLQLGGKKLSELFKDDRDKMTQSAGGEKTASPAGGTGITALTGYSCSGSWMVGVSRPAHSPSLSWQLIEQITSLDTARERSRIGAGFPARKDFFDFFGDEPVKNVPGLSWKDLLKFTGARARRRDRTICPAISVSSVFQTIHKQVLHCLTIAGEIRTAMKGSGKDIYEICKSEQGREHQKRLAKAAENAVTAIFDHVIRLMKDEMISEGQSTTCLACHQRDKCAKVMVPNAASKGGNS